MHSLRPMAATALFIGATAASAHSPCLLPTLTPLCSHDATIVDVETKQPGTCLISSGLREGSQPLTHPNRLHAIEVTE